MVSVLEDEREKDVLDKDAKVSDKSGDENNLLSSKFLGRERKAAAAKKSISAETTFDQIKLQGSQCEQFSLT